MDNIPLENIKQFIVQNEINIRPFYQKLLESKDSLLNTFNSLDTLTALILIFSTSLVLLLSVKTIQFLLRGFALMLFVLTMGSFSLLILVLMQKHVVDLFSGGGWSRATGNERVKWKEQV
ncbi:hypothetical protein K502DRAFT_348370 [Neoconidiobolus thromboides FSU 785]|nr:hypothetical protein K502DRAFT_348370 [Neoconidiobolus thromboides FSU 785]